MKTTQGLSHATMVDDSDIAEEECPARMVFERLTNKWSLQILRRLRRETLRFNQLRRDVDGVSQKVLSQTLKKLERDGLVRRTVYATVPVTVEYSLTEIGATLSDTIETLHQWVDDNMAAVHSAQERYDEENDTD